MYAIVKTGGKQYKVAPGDKLNIEKIEGEPGDKITLDTICVVDGKNVDAKPDSASKTKVEAEIVEQFRGDKILVFKFKKRKNYKRLQGHRQNMTRILITAVGSEKYSEPAKKTKKTASKAKAAKEDASTEKKSTEKAAAKTATKSTATKKTTEKKTAEKKPAAKKATEKKAEDKPAKDAKDEAPKKEDKATKEADTKADDKASEE